MLPRLSCLLLWFVSTFTYAEGVGSPPLFVYVSLAPGRVTASSEVQLDRDIDVATAGLAHTLTGRVSQRDGKLFARLNVCWSGGSATYEGEIELDRPVYAMEGAFSSIVIF